MKKFVVYPYKLGSQSAKILAKGLNTLRIRPDGNYKYRLSHIVINWGNSHAPQWNRPGMKVLNHWSKIQVSVNKLNSLNKLKENNVSTPEFTTDISVAKKWSNEGNVVMCRRILTGHSGAGIVVAKKAAELVNAPLYTKYVKRKAEYRIVIFNGEIIDACQKKRKTDFEGEVNNFVRCNHNGYVYAYENITVPNVVKTEALKAIKALGLDFGSVDVAYNEKANKAYVFECNSSAGFSSNKSPAFQKYLNAFKNYLSQNI